MMTLTSIQWSDGAPIYRQLKDRVIAMMLDGVLKPGKRYIYHDCFPIRYVFPRMSVTNTTGNVQEEVTLRVVYLPVDNRRVTPLRASKGSTRRDRPTRQAVRRTTYEVVRGHKSPRPRGSPPDNARSPATGS